MNFLNFSYKILSETKTCFCFEIAFLSAKTCFTSIYCIIQPELLDWYRYRVCNDYSLGVVNSRVK